MNVSFYVSYANILKNNPLYFDGLWEKWLFSGWKVST